MLVCDCTVCQTLASAEWFCPKLSAATLFAPIYAKTPSDEVK